MSYPVYYNGEVEVRSALSEQDAELLLAVSKMERTDETAPVFESIATSSEPDLPFYSGLLEVSDDRSRILPEEGESDHGVRMWLPAPSAKVRSFIRMCCRRQRLWHC
jgi:hypothetical protein